MNIARLVEAAARALVQRRLKSRQDWIIPVVSDAAQRLCAHIERKFYLGPGSADLEVLVCPSAGVTGIVLAHKRWMSPRQLAALGASLGSNLTDDVAEARDRFDRDVLIVPNSGSAVDLSLAMERVRAFVSWLR